MISGNIEHPKQTKVTTHKHAIEGVFASVDPVNPYNLRIYDKKAFEFYARELEKKLKIESRKNKLKKIESLY